MALALPPSFPAFPPNATQMPTVVATTTHCITFFVSILLLTDIHSAWYHFLATVNSVAVKMDVHVFLGYASKPYGLLLVF